MKVPIRLTGRYLMALALLIAPLHAWADGTVVQWGAPWAQLPAGLSGVVSIAAGYGHGLALKSDGTVVGWGADPMGDGAATPPAWLSGVVAIAAAPTYSLALTRDGGVASWGGMSGFVQGCWGNYPCAPMLQWWNGPALSPGLSGAVAIAAGDEYSLALKGDGTVIQWGVAGYEDESCSDWEWWGCAGGYESSIGWGVVLQPTPPDLSNVVAIAAGGAPFSLALRRDGTVVEWSERGGWDAYEPVLDATPPGLFGVVAIAAGRKHRLALKSDGTIVGWGANNYGQATPPVGLSGVVAIAAGDYHSLALKRDGTVVGWGDNSAGQATPPSGLSRVVAIAAGGQHSLALVASAAPPSSFAFGMPGQPQSTLTLRQGDPPVLTFHLVGANGYVRDGQTPIATLKGCGTIQSVQVASSQVVVKATGGTYVSRNGFFYTKTG